MTKGIFDPTGQNSNPLTGQPYSDAYRTLANAWVKLPVYAEAKKIMGLLEKHPVVLVQSGTGSGKTVILPKLALHQHDYQKMVVVTCPKKAVTREAAIWAAKCLDVEVGNEVGYKFRGQSHFNAKTKLLFTTDGTVLAWLRAADPSKTPMTNVATLILDEVHERSVRIDLLLGLLKKTTLDLRLVLMSATVDVAPYRKFFGTKLGLHSSPGAKMFDITVKHAPKKPEPAKAVDAAAKAVGKAKGDTLIFVASKNDCVRGCALLAEMSASSQDYCAVLYSGLDAKKQAVAIELETYQQENEHATRKVVFSTNVAESSLTVKGLDSVIDTGLAWKSGYDHKHRVQTLALELVSQAEIKQRWGRVGRTAPGTVHALYSPADFKKLNAYPKPDMLVSDLTGETLALARHYGGTRKELEDQVWKILMTPPTKAQQNAAWQGLVALGLADKDALTPLGTEAARFTVEPALAKFLVLAEREGQNSLAAELAALAKPRSHWLDVDPMSKMPADKILEEWRDPRGDPWTLWNALQDFLLRAPEHREGWCKRRQLNFRSWQSVKKDARRLRGKGKSEEEQTPLQKLLLQCLRPLEHVKGDQYKCRETGVVGVWEHAKAAKFPQTASALAGFRLGKFPTNWLWVVAGEPSNGGELAVQCDCTFEKVLAAKGGGGSAREQARMQGVLLEDRRGKVYLVQGFGEKVWKVPAFRSKTAVSKVAAGVGLPAQTVGKASEQLEVVGAKLWTAGVHRVPNLEAFSDWTSGDGSFAKLKCVCKHCWRDALLSSETKKVLKHKWGGGHHQVVVA